MITLNRAEQIFFSEGPDSLRIAAFAFAFIGFAGGMAVILSAEGGFEPRYLWLAGIGLVPAVICWLLSIAVRHRHITVIPLTMALCALSLYLFSGNPSNAAEGVSPYLPVLIGVWLVTILEYILIAVVMFYIFHLWKKGAFS